jgi:hypothetical protein
MTLLATWGIAMTTTKTLHIDEVQPISDTDRLVLADVAEVLRKHNCLDRFGVFLTHKHFELAPDEILTEYTDEAAREQRIVVEKRGEPAEKYIETSWRFDHDGLTAITVCALRCYYNKGHKLVHRREWR